MTCDVCGKRLGIWDVFRCHTPLCVFHLCRDCSLSTHKWLSGWHEQLEAQAAKRASDILDKARGKG